MNNFQQQVQELENQIAKWQERLKVLNESFKSLRDKFSVSQATVTKQEKELKVLEKGLFECSESRKEIQGKLDKKVVELENSNLAKEEIAQQVIQLLTKSGFTQVKDKLLKTWSNYAKSKDDFSKLRIESLNIKEERTREAVESLEITKRGLWITVFVLLFVVFLLSLSLSLSYFYQRISKKKKKR